MENIFSYFNYVDVKSDAQYKKGLEESIDILALKKVNEAFFPWYQRIFGYFGTLVIANMIMPEKYILYIFMLITILFLYYLITLKSRRKKYFLKAKETLRSFNYNYIKVIEVLNTIKGKNVAKLGKGFYIKYNEITDRSVRNYFGEVLIEVENDIGKIYIDSGTKNTGYYVKEFLKSDIETFRLVSPEGLGDISMSINQSNIQNIITLENRANNLNVEATISGLASNPLSSNFISNVRAANASVEVAKERRKLESKAKNVKEESIIKFLKFKDGTSLLICYLNNAGVRTLERMIEE